MVGRLAVAAWALAACGNSAGAEGTSSTSTATAANSAAGSEVVLVTHDSFVVDDAVLADFEKSSGLTVTVLAQGDAGAMVNQLVLTKNNPLGDAVFGIDNSSTASATTG
jgi:thiamine transport system substrate-binding protein